MTTDPHEVERDRRIRELLRQVRVDSLKALQTADRLDAATLELRRLLDQRKNEMGSAQ